MQILHPGLGLGKRDQRDLHRHLGDAGTLMVMKPVAQATTADGVPFKSKTRLFVVLQVASSIIAFLSSYSACSCE